MNRSSEKEILELAKAAMRFRTTADRREESAACLDMLARYLEGAPLGIERREHGGFPSAIIRPAGVDRPRVLLCGHLDVVPGDDAQFEPRVEGDRLIGRGSLDMKGSLAAVAAVVRETAALGIPWWLLVVSDEETGGKDGAGMLAAEGWPAELFFAAEPTDMAISLQSKGALRLEIAHHGKKAHASTPWKGDSSVERVMRALPLIREVVPEIPVEDWRTTAALTIIHGGAAINQVPDECRLSVDIRYIPGDDPREILAALEKKLDGLEVRVLDLFPPMVCREDAPLVLSLKETFRRVTGREAVLGREHGATDARYFAERMDALIFGPSGDDIHGSGEWVSIPSLVEFAAVLRNWGQAWLIG